MLGRLADALARLADAPPAPPCPDCRAPMALRGEEPVGELPVAIERFYVCRRCGRHLTRCVLWAIPD
jgi:hypothetical protein